MKLGESPRDLAVCARMAGERSSNAGNHRGNVENNTSKFGMYYIDPAARKPKDLDTEDDWRNNGILHGRNVTTGLDDRPEVGDCGPLPGFARTLQCIMKERADSLSIQNPQRGDGARAKSRTRRAPYEPGQEGGRCRFGLFSTPRCRGGRFYSSATAGFRIINAVVSEK